MRNGLIIDKFGDKRYFLNDLLHREDGPAIESPNGTKAYLIHGKYHREGGLPAIEYLNGDKSYLVNGKYHREDGPAMDSINGNKWYYLNDKEYPEQDYWKEIKRRKSLNFILANLKKNNLCNK